MVYRDSKGRFAHNPNAPVKITQPKRTAPFQDSKGFWRKPNGQFISKKELSHAQEQQRQRSRKATNQQTTYRTGDVSTKEVYRYKIIVKMHTNQGIHPGYIYSRIPRLTERDKEYLTNLLQEKYSHQYKELRVYSIEFVTTYDQHTGKRVKYK